MKLVFSGANGAGKSTLMAACAGHKALAGARGRDEAGQAVLAVPDPRVDRLSGIFKPQKTTYAQIVFVDPPMPASKPDDPAARLPTELRQADGLILVAANFSASPLAGAQEQIDSLEQDFLLSDLITVERRLERMAQEKQRGRAPDNEELQLLERARVMLEQEKPLRIEPVFASHPKLKGFALISAKPLLVVINNGDDDPRLPDLRLPLAVTSPPLLVRARLEAELAELTQEERLEFMRDYGLSGAALDKLISQAYRSLDLISFFTVGADEVRAWTVANRAPAELAAGVIHSDLQKGFIRAEVMAYADLLELGSEAAVKKAGRYKLAGRDYPLADGDILHVRFNV
jgi:ribosome-binding ATPase YchF (GTP1/OBG family)